MSIHSRDDRIILEFGLRKPAFRICVNTPATHGSIGLTTGLDPAMTLGCGGYGGNITSDNISPRHLLNIKRLAYEIRPAERRPDGPEPSSPATVLRLPQAPAGPAARGIDVATLAARIDAFLASRGYALEAHRMGPAAPAPGRIPGGTARRALPSPEASVSLPATAPEAEKSGGNGPPRPAEFVCEDDVRAALRTGRKILLGEHTIVTPAARDLGDSQQIFLRLHSSA
jgi:acetaldehyde dehydrogenase (acetylating)